MSDLSPESRALLGREGPLDEASGADLDARREAIFRALGVPPPAALPTPTTDTPTAPDPASSAAPASPASMGGSAWPTGAKVALAIAAALVLGAGALLLSPNAEQGPSDSAEGTPLAAGADAGGVTLSSGDSPEALVAGDAPTVEPAPEPADAPPALRPERAPARGDVEEAPRAAVTTTPAVVVDPARVTAPPPPLAPPLESADAADELAPDPLSEESMLVAAGEAQLRAGHAANALTLFERALARHPRGTLRVEALAGRALALCRAGRTEAGQREAARFLTAYPRSPSAPRIREACGVAP
ncbi:MAG: hypothetical protein IPI43_12655 [Sandaracinaceae bacterium]|jgi:hypothetical protein|nr:hypothetical protein [Sandaracinaceae bacterium]MBK7156080.1 hypothetical protein [Sandaracinaceae bacterium]MBK7774963.1 hypothetical protein [Sandaracinaceae bacterium]